MVHYIAKDSHNNYIYDLLLNAIKSGVHYKKGDEEDLRGIYMLQMLQNFRLMLFQINNMKIAT